MLESCRPPSQGLRPGKTACRLSNKKSLPLIVGQILAVLLQQKLRF
jgi:hypothetical protein